MARPQTSAPGAVSVSRLAILARAGAFARRFWPLWLAWVVVWALPPSRDYARQVWLGSDLASYGQVSVRETWEEMFSLWSAPRQAPENPLPDASRHPQDLDLALWQMAYQRVWDNQPISQAALERIAARFPDQTVALALPVQHDVGAEFGVVYYRGVPNNADAKRLLLQARRGQKLESENAFWWVAEALAHWRARHSDAALAALERAARCPRYDDKTLEVARRAVAAHERYGAPSLDDKILIADRLRASDLSQVNAKGVAWIRHAKKLRASDAARSLRWRAALAGVGDLMMRAPNSLAMVSTGQLWQRAWSLGATVKRGAPKTDWAETFAREAQAGGRADIAKTTRAQSQRARALLKQLPKANRFGSPDNSLQLGDGPFRTGTRAQWLEGASIAGVLGVCAGIYLGLWWLGANLFLWRARGAPSSRRTRALPALFVGALCLALALVATVFGLHFASGSTGPQPLVEALLIAMSLPSFFGAPFLLALWCALGTLRANRAAFALPRRVDVELRLSPLQRALLNRFVPVAFFCCLATASLGLVLWLAARWQGWGNVDMLALLPPDRKGHTVSLLWDMSGTPVPLIYGVFLLVLCLPVWFWKWRWASASAQRPVTQGGLRWWKESLGGLIVLLSWLFLCAGLSMWPLRAGAETELDNVLRAGEIARLPPAK